MADDSGVEMGLLQRNNENEFILKYRGAGHEINAFTLSHSLAEISTILQAANQELETGKRIDIRIRALTPESFDVHVVLNEQNISTAIASIFTVANVSSAREIINFFLDLLNLREKFGSKPSAPPEQTSEGAKFNAPNGTIVYVDARAPGALQKPIFAQGLDRIFETLKEDESIVGFDVLNAKKETLFSSDRDQFDRMIVGEKAQEEQQVSQRTYLVVSNPSLLDPKQKWVFLFFGNRIFASIEDVEFLDKVSKHTEPFYGGEQMEVNLTVIQTWDNKSKAYRNKEFIITKVYDIKRFPVDQQLALPETEESPAE